MAVGVSADRVDGIEKVTGQAKFTGDLTFPGLLEAKVLRSPLPHAAIESIDIARAAAMPGVCAVLTRADLQAIDPFYGNCLRDRPILALDRVRFVGEPVAVVAAEDALSAESALALIEVHYRELPCLGSVDDALAEGAILIHDSVSEVGEFHDIGSLGGAPRPNVCHHEGYEKGDIAQGFLASDQVIEESFDFPMVCHYAMEPHTAVARVTQNGISLWSSSAHPFLVRSELAHMFHLPQSKVEVIVPYVGGAYGSKSYFKIEPLAVAMACKTSGRPVRVAQSVSESMLTTRRHSAQCRIRTGVKKDGTLVAREATVILDTGAYADNGPRVAKRAVSRMIGPYRLQHSKVEAVAVYTNTVPAGSMRSIGGPQTIWALESHMDNIARCLAMDPLEFRLKNLLKPGEPLREGARPIDADLAMGTNIAARGIGWSKIQKGPERGLGIAVGVSDSEAMPVSVALVRLLADGSVMVMAGSTEVGQGARTVLSQIAAYELDVPLAQVTMQGTDTLFTPFDRSTGASRSTTVMGNAVKAAAQELRQQIIAAAATTQQLDPERIVLKDGAVIFGSQRVSYSKIVSTFFGMAGGELIGRGYIRPGEGMDAKLPIFWETGMAGVDLQVDRETGSLTLNKLVSVADVGKAINPCQCEGQDEGAMVQGLGHTLFESLVFENGQPLNPNLVDYRVPLMTDLPKIFDSALVENQDGPGPYGAKGMGESGIVSVAPAIANAIFDAAGIRIRQLPLTPERVWRALHKKSHK